MKLTIFNFIFLLFFSVCVVLAQNERSAGMSFSGGYLSDSQGNIVKPNSKNNTPEGSPYLPDDWSKGHVILANEKGFDVQRVRFIDDDITI